MKKIFLLLVVAGYVIQGISAQSKKAQPQNDRQVWLQYLDKVARPVLQNLAADKLKANMPVAFAAHIDNKESRSKVAYLEAFGRLLSGIGPWLNSEGGSAEEVALRNQYRSWTLQAIANSVNPLAKDYLRWDGGQPLVDASFFALGLVRAPWVWQHLDAAVQQQVVEALKITRKTTPGYTNWILFSGMIEAFFCKYGLEYDQVRMDYGVRAFMQQWYVGDGMFSDGMHFHQDFYNSYVIQPYLMTIVDVVNNKNKAYQGFAPRLDRITKRYAELQEKTINADGSFPVIGRSIIYRGGAFHQLADMALQQRLPQSLKPGQVKSALTAVIKKTLDAPATFTKDGWLNIGLYGTQPELADVYITTGSLYLCAEIFLPLGLPETADFWSAPYTPWTAVKVWGGQDMPADHALDLN